MPELTREEKLKLAEKLPRQLQEFMYSEDTGAALLYLGQKYKLPEEKVHLLSKLTGDVILGIKQIASLAQEIYSNILPDAKLAMDLAQELYSDVLAPALTPPAVPVPDVAPAFGAKGQSPIQQNITSAPGRPDYYREPATPEVVDLRKVPPVPVPGLSPYGRSPEGRPSVETKPPVPMSPPKSIIPPPAPILPKPTPPVTSKIEPPPLIEAEPHKAPLSEMPQVILRSPGLPPTDLPRDILDLRKDKGEF